MSRITKKRGMRILPLAVWLLLYPVAAMAGTLRTGAVLAPQQNAVTFEEHIKKSQDAYDAKNYGVARNEAREALKLKKDSPEANLMLAFASKGLSRADDATKYAKKAIQYKADYTEAHYLLAVLFYEKSDLKKAVSETNLAIQLGARFTNVFLLKGTLELLANQRSAALDSYKEALSLAKPDDPAMTAIKQRVAALEATIEGAKHMGDPAYSLPKPLNAPAPRYTEDARQNHIQGKVQMAMALNESGEITTIVLLTTLGHGLDEEAVRAARQLKFSPATKDGKPKPYWVAVWVEFNLR